MGKGSKTSSIEYDLMKRNFLQDTEILFPENLLALFSMYNLKNNIRESIWKILKSVLFIQGTKVPIKNAQVCALEFDV